jgi:hypothetical protein
MKQRPEIMLWLDDHRGQYIPRDFAQSFVDRASAVTGVSDDQWAILEAGPVGGLDSEGDGSEYYWEVWQEVCDYAIVTDEHGNKYRIHQDGACWLIPDGMEWSDQDDWFRWPDDSDPEYEHEDKLDPPGWEGGFADNH